MNNATLFIILGSLLVSTLASIVYIVLMTTNKSSIKSKSLDIAEDLQRIDTKDPTAARFSDKFIIHSSIP